MNRNKNFFDELGQDWSETLTDIYTKSNIDTTLGLFKLGLFIAALGLFIAALELFIINYLNLEIKK